MDEIFLTKEDEELYLEMMGLIHNPTESNNYLNKLQIKLDTINKVSRIKHKWLRNWFSEEDHTRLLSVFKKLSTPSPHSISIATNKWLGCGECIHHWRPHHYCCKTSLKLRLHLYKKKEECMFRQKTRYYRYYREKWNAKIRDKAQREKELRFTKKHLYLKGGNGWDRRGMEGGGLNRRGKEWLK